MAERELTALRYKLAALPPPGEPLRGGVFVGRQGNPDHARTLARVREVLHVRRELALLSLTVTSPLPTCEVRRGRERRPGVRRSSRRRAPSRALRRSRLFRARRAT
jgi:hypothetical protein